MGFPTLAMLLLTFLADPPPIGAPESVRPALVRLAFEDQTLVEIVRALDRQGPNRIELGPPPGLPPGTFVDDDPARPKRKLKPKPPPRRFDFREPAPLTFWQAVERVCAASEHRPTLLNGPERRVLLVAASPGRGFVDDDGAFRIALTRATYRRGGILNLSPRSSEGGATGRKSGPPPDFFCIELAVTPEPRLTIVEAGDLKIHAAVDDQGQSLLVPDDQERPSPGDLVRVTNPEGVAYFDLKLKYPDKPSRLIRKLSGSVMLRFVEKTNSPPIQSLAKFEFADVPMP